jgi:hypothetical protein
VHRPPLLFTALLSHRGRGLLRWAKLETRSKEGITMTPTTLKGCAVHSTKHPRSDFVEQHTTQRHGRDSRGIDRPHDSSHFVMCTAPLFDSFIFVVFKGGLASRCLGAGSVRHVAGWLTVSPTGPTNAAQTDGLSLFLPSIKPTQTLFFFFSFYSLQVSFQRRRYFQISSVHSLSGHRLPPSLPGNITYL